LFIPRNHRGLFTENSYRVLNYLIVSLDTFDV
jgi:hypothetical protein